MTEADIKEMANDMVRRTEEAAKLAKDAIVAEANMFDDDDPRKVGLIVGAATQVFANMLYSITDEDEEGENGEENGAAALCSLLIRLMQTEKVLPMLKKAGEIARRS